MRLIIATPFYMNSGNSKYFASLLGFCKLLGMIGIDFDFWNHEGDSYVDRARNTIVARFMQDEKATDLLFIDSDMTFQFSDKQAIINFLGSDKEVLGGAYPIKNNWEAYGLAIDTDDEGKPIVEADTGLIKGSRCSAGFMRIKKSCIEKMQEAYPDRMYRDASGGEMRTCYSLFECVIRDERRWGEDYEFCRKWTEIGGEVWIEPRITFGHYGINGWHGNYHEFLMRQPEGCWWAPSVNRMGDPLVSIIIPCYNYGEYLGDAIDSALAQTYKNIEIIVVNDGSTDNSEEVALKYPQVKYISQENLGVGRARNRGFAESNGQWLMMLDADDMILPEYVEKCLAVEGEVDIIGTGQQEFGLSDNRWIFQPEPKYKDFARSNQINCSSLFKREIYEVIGGWDSGVDGYEDWDFWLRATKVGFKVKTVQEPLFLYRKHGPSMIDYSIENHQMLTARMFDKMKTWEPPQREAH